MGFANFRVQWGAWHDHTYMATATIGKFTIGVVAAYDMYGPMVEAMGIQSWTGVTLVVKWMNLVC